MLTSENSGFLDNIANQFKHFRELLEDNEEDSCLCKECLKQCEKLSKEECGKSYDNFMCYVEDDKCTTRVSTRFGHLCKKCNTTGEKIGKQMQKFKYQLFLEEYMTNLNEIPNDKANSRGLLIYHGLGSGKTCSGLLLTESCRKYGGNKMRKVLIMIPASLLLDPWIKELSSHCNKNYKLSKELRKVYNSNKEKLENGQKIESEIEQKKTYKKICEKYRYYIIHYNANTLEGGWKDVLNRIRVKEGEDNVFDNSVILIDEVHNFVNSIVNSNETNVQATKKDLYDRIYIAKNSRIIFLTGTPIYNKPIELAYIFNMVRGKIKNNENINFTTDEIKFEKLFLKKEGDRFKFINPNMFRRRINGLVSYYRGANKNQFAQKKEDIVYVPFSSSQHDNYKKVFEMKNPADMESESGKYGDNNLFTNMALNTQMISNVSLPSYLFDKNSQLHYKGKGRMITKGDKPIQLFNDKGKVDSSIKAIKIKQRTYKNQILPPLIDSNNKVTKKNIIALLDNDDKPLKLTNNLHTISRKMYHALKYIMASNGPILFYSKFEGLHGISMFAEVLKQNGYIDFDKLSGKEEEVKRRQNLPEFLSNGKKNKDKIIGTYMLWTGSHAKDETRKIFNKFENYDGSIIKWFLMTAKGKEGINLLGI